MEIACPCSADFDGVPSIADSNHSNHPPQKLSIPMKLFIRICLSLCAAALFASTANAQYLNPWSGWWGAGYYGSPAYSAPVYTSYYGSPSYTSFYGSSSSSCCGTAAPAYAVSYGSCGTGCCGSGCCTTSCCDACGSGCASGSCTSGSCAGIAPAGSLKPAQDPISDKKTPDYEDDTRSRRFDPDAASPRAPRTNDPLDDPLNDRTDQFRSPRSGTGTDTGSGTGTNMFEDAVDPALERTNQKPPMTDPLDGKALDPVDSNSDPPADSSPGAPVDEKTFFEDTSKPDNSASRGRDAVIARTGSLSEVIAPKRLASRSLPASHRSASGSQLADKSNKTEADAPRPLRWISAPLADGHVQL